jgi:DNA-binding transcriptional MerR regulator
MIPITDCELVTRKQVATLFGRIHVATIIRLEREGLLKPIRLRRSPTAQVFYRAADVRSLIEKRAAHVS